MGLIVKQVFTSTGSSEIIGTVANPHGVQNLTCYIAHSTLASTNSFVLQSAIESSGPWFTEGSTELATGNVSTAFRLQVTGPVGLFVRGVLRSASTGNYSFLLMGLD